MAAARDALVTRERRHYDFGTKLEIVLRHVEGESGRALAEEYGLPSPSTVANWTSIYRREGETGCDSKGAAGPRLIEGTRHRRTRSRHCARRTSDCAQRSRTWENCGP
ncbi:helix-turn-helix domain-containing protein [Amycolatopsis sp. NPDC059090]|uniref:helix-turn-helix domain-containing protein n=1 Tax=Amycolatopsis sp. NPDC059090 TaxID=3346723 RepID=UPI00366F717E